MKKAVIIGAGIGGLATANLLAVSGYEVEIYEKQPIPGGRAGTFSAEGFTFDTGPSWYLMPEVFEHYFGLFGINIAEKLELQRLDPAYKVFFETYDSPITIHAATEKDYRTFEDIESGAGDALNKYINQAEDTYKAALKYFLYTNFASLKSLVNKQIMSMGPKMLRKATQPIDSYVSSFFRDQRLKQIMEYPMVFLGTSPFEAPAIYSLMSYMDFKQGVFYPKRGVYSVIQALIELCAANGVAIWHNSPVASITTNGKRASGITLENGSTISADIVISNADIHFTETKLLSAKHRTYSDSYWAKRQASPSAILMYLGIQGKLPELEHHNLIFTEDWKYNFDTIFKDKDWPNPASMYVCVPSKTDETVAPKGTENVFVLIPGPATLKDSPEEITKLSDMYIDQLAKHINISDFRARIMYKKIVGPDHFATSFNSWDGTALGLSHNLKQSALFRPKNKSSKLNNLYYVGANTVPGIGLPMCLISAQLVLKRLQNDVSNSPLADLGGDQ